MHLKAFKHYPRIVPFFHLGLLPVMTVDVLLYFIINIIICWTLNVTHKLHYSKYFSSLKYFDIIAQSFLNISPKKLETLSFKFIK